MMICWLNITAVSAQLHQLPNSSVVNIPYGKNNLLVYNLQTGTLTVSFNGHAVIAGAFASVKNGDNAITSKQYTHRQLAKQALADQQGRGTKYTITLTGDQLPVMEQVFYIYQSQDYFFTDVWLKGTALSSNYMAPLVAPEGDILQKGDVRDLFVPFDNDTFIRYNAKAVGDGLDNTSSEVGAVYENQSRAGLVIGSVEHLVWKTGVKTSARYNKLSGIEVWGGYTAEPVTRDKMAHGTITGDHIKSPKIFVGYFTDWRQGMELYAKSNRRFEKPFVFNWNKATPVGWNSWGVLQDHITYDKVIKVASFFADSMKTFRSGNTAFIDLDAFWDYITPGGLNGDMAPLKRFVAYCKSKGLSPGVYWAPFTDWGWKGPGVRKVEGSDYSYNEIWTKVNDGYHDLDGGRALDPTHPGTQQRMAFTLKRLKDCGFEMIKIDFLAHGAIESNGFYNKNIKTGMQAYRVGMEYLVKQLGSQMLIYAAISPSLATARYVHTRRIACDAFHSMDNSQYTLNSINYGWWQTYAYNYVDADHIVFDHETPGINRIRLTSGLITGPLLTGDDYSADGPWKHVAQSYLQNKEVLKLIAHGTAFQPVEANTNDQCGNYYVRRFGDVVYLAVFNFSSNAQHLRLDAERIGLKKNAVYSVQDIYQGTSKQSHAEFDIDLPQHDAVIYKIEIRVHGR
ncbi:alpha-galactosidase [Mucilaginibacter paludis]|uniref:Carbohydrate binding family 6 n=1 Tax=Mucilaginibacter paludis DSM 18603 TaxID=714943 RepID=H1YAH9_9SPHI|nr:alpha-galactosidase [Mucilaginibacter paludis]EHQ29099.1 carbohydrate binding family 6 [Mucilaginibacter paludis DSM 18603]